MLQKPNNTKLRSQENYKKLVSDLTKAHLRFKSLQQSSEVSDLTVQKPLHTWIKKK